LDLVFTQGPNRPVRVHLVQMNSGARVVNSALVSSMYPEE
jgi:hypothetical protein